MHKIVPITATPLLIGFFLCAETPEIIPTTRKIIPIQFSQPNKGTKPIKTNTKPKIAKIVTIHHKKFTKNRHYPLFKEIQM